MLSRFKRQHKRENFHYSTIIPSSKIILPEYFPASRQAEEFHTSKKEIRAFFGGDRSGKTGTFAFEMVSLMREHPGELFWSAALTQDKIPAIWKWHKTFLHPAEIQKVSWINENEDKPGFLRLKNGAKMQYLTSKSGPGVFSAESVKAIHIDEDPERVTTKAEQIWNDCLSRILDNDGYLFLSATPVLGKNWMYRRVFQKNIDNREDGTPDPDIETWTVSLLDNRYITDEQKAKAKGRMSQDEIDRRFYGLFTTLTGACFKEWREDIHVKEFDVSASWKRIRSIDLGYENPFCCLWIAQDPEGTLFVYDEYYKAKTLIKHHAETIKEMTRNHEKMFLDMDKFRPIITSLSDHERQTRAELHSQGIVTVPAKKDVEEGIQIVNRLLKIREDGKTSVYVHPRCRNLRREIGTYHYKTNSLGKEEPVKEDDHAVDPFRYACVYFDTHQRDYSVLQ